MKGKVNRRVDFLLSVLFHIEEDNFFDYRRKRQLPFTSNKDGMRHQRAMAIPTEKVEVNIRQVKHVMAAVSLIGLQK